MTYISLVTQAEISTPKSAIVRYHSGYNFQSKYTNISCNVSHYKNQIGMYFSIHKVLGVKNVTGHSTHIAESNNLMNDNWTSDAASLSRLVEEVFWCIVWDSKYEFVVAHWLDVGVQSV